MTDLYSGFKIANLIAKRLEGKLTAEEEQFLEGWKYEREENLVLFHKLSQNPEKQFFQRETKLEKVDKDVVWNKIQTEVYKKRVVRIKNQMLKIAAVLLVVVGTGFFFSTQHPNENQKKVVVIPPGKNQAVLVLADGEKYQLSEKVNLQQGNVLISNDSEELVYQDAKDNKSEKQLAYNTIVIPKGGEYKLTLMDGTKIWLNSNSKLRYPAKFGNGERKVQLEGEAFFQVAKDSTHPFVVDVNTVKIKVLGTSFNVNSYDQEDQIVTTLVEGKVELKDEFWGNCQQLLPNDQLCFNKLNGNISKRKVDTRLYTAWKDGRFVFENESLEDIMTRLSRWYDIEVFFLENSVKNLKYSGDLARYENINTILNMIEITERVKFTINERSVMIEENTK